ncbi:hypothetical protein DFH09DRAFT_1069835 [Mycena vulgaris]|nr:hypothetical protein DFH09DRAFT_1069835 [Mycena vulgaris]
MDLRQYRPKSEGLRRRSEAIEILRGWKDAIRVCPVADAHLTRVTSAPGPHSGVPTFSDGVNETVLLTVRYSPKLLRIHEEHEFLAGARMGMGSRGTTIGALAQFGIICSVGLIIPVFKDAAPECACLAVIVRNFDIATGRFSTRS